MIRDHQQTLTDVAKELRHKQTPAEKILWDIVRTKKFLGLKFRRQHPIKFYVVDFCCVAPSVLLNSAPFPLRKLKNDWGKGWG